MTRTVPYARAGAGARIRTLRNENARMRLSAMTAARHPAVEGEDTFHRAEGADLFRRAGAAVFGRQQAAAASKSPAARVLQQAAGWDCFCSAGF